MTLEELERVLELLRTELGPRPLTEPDGSLVSNAYIILSSLYAMRLIHGAE